MNITNNGKRLKIALYANHTDGFVGQSIAYMDYFSDIGEVVLVTTESDFDRITEECDVLAMPGGPDVNSILYGKSPGWHASKINPHFEYLDEMLLPSWILTGKPIIAICRGMQALNVRMGGTLHRHIKGHIQASDRDEPVHDMYTDWPSHARICKINSFHHQAVERIAPGFVVMGWSHIYDKCPSRKTKHPFLAHQYWRNKETGQMETTQTKMYSIIECMQHETLPYVAFQYHPEELKDKFSLSLIETVLDKHFNQHTNANQKAVTA